MKNLKIYKIILTIGVILLSFWSGKGVTETKYYHLNRAANKYYNKCEALLDNIAKNDSTFMDTTEETDFYYKYLIAREKYDSLYSITYDNK